VKPLTTLAQPERYFGQNYYPSPTSKGRRVDALALAVDELREHARREAKKTEQTACKK
jgi:hypothetical protein